VCRRYPHRRDGSAVCSRLCADLGACRTLVVDRESRKEAIMAMIASIYTGPEARVEKKTGERDALVAQFAA
jgi:hypothetical protein